MKGTKYENDSGGNPENITDLSYEEFLTFAKSFYHPSNCSFVSYGDLDFRKHIEFLEHNYLQYYEKKPFNVDNL